MPKNGALVTAWLDWSQDWSRRLRAAETEEEFDRILEEPHPQWDACLADGWTVEELDEMAIRRYGLDEKRAQRIRQMRASRR